MKLLIANWKMQFSHDEACSWLEQEIPSLQQLCATTGQTLVICPSFTELSYATAAFPDVLWGAQTCSSHLKGAYTGDVSARSLRELQITYCLVGHSEQRVYHGVTNKHVAQKVALLYSHDIQPIICIGETKECKNEFEKVLTQQLQLIPDGKNRIIAYEPVWSIGTGEIPSPKQLEQRTAFIKKMCGEQTKVLYGGSVTEHEVSTFGSLVEGFLIGGASLDANLLKKIILSC